MRKLVIEKEMLKEWLSSTFSNKKYDFEKIKNFLLECVDVEFSDSDVKSFMEVCCYNRRIAPHLFTLFLINEKRVNTMIEICKENKKRYTRMLISSIGRNILWGDSHKIREDIEHFLYKNFPISLFSGESLGFFPIDVGNNVFYFLCRIFQTKGFMAIYILDNIFQYEKESPIVLDKIKKSLPLEKYCSCISTLLKSDFFIDFLNGETDKFISLLKRYCRKLNTSKYSHLIMREIIVPRL